MKFAALFLWLLVPVGLWGAVTIWGTPHAVVTYRYHGSSYLPPADRRYIDCTYLGVWGTVTMPASQERCPWVRLIKGAP